MNRSQNPRYAIYYAPPKDSGLWSTAQRWLGRDCESGQALTQEIPDGWLADEIDAATESPRRYGFHCTLKAPFRLPPAATPEDLMSALTAFAARQKPFEAPPLKVSAIGPFLALTLSVPSPEMEALATAAVQAFEPFRAPLRAEETERRIAGGLTPRQQELLKAWGYPYVMEEFRFHMSLSGPLEAARRDRLQAALVKVFQGHTIEPFAVDEVCLYRQNETGAPFLLIERMRFGPQRADRMTATPQGETA